MPVSPYPFSAVVGADDVKLALVLAAVEPAIGGVLLRGEKGSAKTTLARGLAALLPGDAPFVELPVGATEDRLIGALDLAEALAGREMRLRPGLLAAAHGGVLYVDEVNLLPDHLVDVLLDVAASGVNRVERDGIAHAHAARFVLIGSMNPEEGELRPQLLDRFGLCVDVTAPADPVVRARAVRRRLGFDTAPDRAATVWAAEEKELAARLGRVAGSPLAALTDDVIEAVSAMCVDLAVEGLRADLVICRAAAALAAWEGRAEVTLADVRTVAPMALAHRARRDPLDQHGFDGGRLDDALDRSLGSSPPPGQADRSGSGAVDQEGEPDLDDDTDPDEETGPEEDAGPDEDTGPDGNPGHDRASGGYRPAAAPGAAPGVIRLQANRPAPVPAAGRRSVAEGPRGRLVGDRVPGPGGPASVAMAATVREAVIRRAADGGPVVIAADIREAVREQRSGNLIVLTVDASGSMGAPARMEAAKGAVLGLLVDAYQRRDRVALVTFGGDAASVALRPTASVEVAKQRLAALPTGGRTPLAAGIEAAMEVASSPTAATHAPLIVVLTDGRATWAQGEQDPVDAARAAAAVLRRRGWPAVVVDVEEGPTRLGLAAELAGAMGARLLTLDELTAPSLVAAVRGAQAPGPWGPAPPGSGRS